MKTLFIHKNRMSTSAITDLEMRPHTHGRGLRDYMVFVERLDPGDARLIARDGGIDSLIEACSEQSCPDDPDMAELNLALMRLKEYLECVAKTKGAAK